MDQQKAEELHRLLRIVLCGDLVWLFRWNKNGTFPQAVEMCYRTSQLPELTLAKKRAHGGHEDSLVASCACGSTVW